MAPRTTSLAGALWTPRVVSLRPQRLPCDRRRHEDVLAAGGVEHLEPGPVEGRELGVVAGPVDAPLLDLLGIEPGRSIEDGQPVAHQLAVGDHRQLDGLHALGVDHPALVGSHHVGDHDHGHVVDRLEAAEAGSVGAVAHVLVGRDARGCGGSAATGQLLAACGRPTFGDGASGYLFEADEAGCALTTVTAPACPRRVLRLSKDSTTSLPFLTTMVKRSSGSVVPVRVGDLHGRGRCQPRPPRAR